MSPPPPAPGGSVAVRGGLVALQPLAQLRTCQRAGYASRNRNTDTDVDFRSDSVHTWYLPARVALAADG